MRTKKAIITSALAVPMLALGGGIAYASTTSGSPPPATRPAVTTVQTTAHNPGGQASRNGQRYDHRCDWRGHGYQGGQYGGGSRWGNGGCCGNGH